MSTPTPPIDQNAFRQCLGQFATGVTVVTCATANGVHHGTTANSFSSVSLEPPLVLWNIAKDARSLTAYLAADRFAINVLRDDQQALSTHFAQSEDALFDDIAHDLTEYGVPILRQRLALLECYTEQIHEAGDHYIIVARVERFEISSGAPLLFFGGQYAALRSS